MLVGSLGFDDTEYIGLDGTELQTLRTVCVRTELTNRGIKPFWGFDGNDCLPFYGQLRRKLRADSDKAMLKAALRMGFLRKDRLLRSF